MGIRVKRNINRMSAEDRLMVGVKAIANRSFVSNVKYDYLSDFDELILDIVIKPNSSDEETLAMYYDLLSHLEQFLEKEKPNFIWLLKISRGTEVVLFESNS